MDETRLTQILEQFPQVKILIVGDFFLDNYLNLDRELSEISLETGLEAYQVVKVRKSPGAAGTVAANLRTMHVHVLASGVIGGDGNGFELRGKLEEIGVDTRALYSSPELFTPTYNKPMMREPDGIEHELNRLDIKNRSPLPPDAETAIIEQMRPFLSQVQGVLIVDQVQERNCGVITDRVRADIQLLARENPAKFFITDSRERAGMFRDVILKTNLGEAMKAAGKAGQNSAGHPKIVEECCRVLFSQTHHPVIVTRGENGCALFLGPGSPLVEINAVPVEGPVDIVGAGDSFLAAVGASLCAGANLEEAVLIGNLAASIVIQQIGTTGTASQAQIIERFKEFKNLFT